MEEQPPATVSVATGAMGLVLQKLTALLGDEQHRSRLGAGTCSDIESIRSMLVSQSLHSLLLRIWERDDLGAECKEWMAEARALSYDMEDDIDDFMLGLERSDDVGHGGLNKLFLNLKMRLKAVSRGCREEWKTTTAPHEAISNKRSQPSPADPRAGFLHKDASELVGIDRPFSDLQQLLRSGDHEMVCIHGFAGTGKTTLADMVYQKFGNDFECRAFVSLSKSPDMLEALGAILTQVTEGVHSVERTCTEPTPEENLIHNIYEFLSDKRYLVIVDDIWLWQSWEIIRRALPKGNRLCRIIATTRSPAIAEKCCLTEEGATIYRHSGIDARAASKLSRKILLQRNIELILQQNIGIIGDLIAHMCGGMILAVRCFSSAASIIIRWWYDNDEHRLQKLWHVLLDGLRRNNPELIPMVESLRLGYDDLPVHLKTCLLYCSILPTGYKIERHGLVRKWITQGFFPQGPEQEKEAAAEACLDELVYRGLLQQEPASSAGEKTSSYSYCSVHPMMRAFLLWRSNEANFATCIELPPHVCPRSYFAAATGPLFVGFDARPDTISKMHGSSRPRSLIVFGHTWTDDGSLFDREQWERVQLLSIEDNRVPLRDTDLVAISTQMLRLRHLGVKGAPTRVVPPEIGRLQNLETLDVSDTGVRELPKEIGKLHRLRYLGLKGMLISVLPPEIGGLQSLETLDVSDTGVRELPKEIEKLHRLKTLNVTSMVRELPWWLSSSSVSVLVVGKEVKIPRGTWSSPAIPGENLSILLCVPLCQPLHAVAGLKDVSRYIRVPEWIKQHLTGVSTLDIKLCQLVDDDLDFLRNEMPYLLFLTLRLEVLPRKAIVITGAGFPRLESFCLDCRLPMVTFQQGAMPKLEHLEFKFYTSRALTCEDPMGIRHLLSLKRVLFQSSPRYKSNAPGISVVINKVREEAKKHPNKITISINGKDEEVIQEKKEATTTTSASDKISEVNIVTSGGAGGSSEASMINTSLPSPYDNGGVDEKGSIIPVESYYPFGIAK